MNGESESASLHDLESLLRNLSTATRFDQHVQYDHGELDLRIKTDQGYIYLEFKNRHSTGARHRATQQIHRAMQAKECIEGYYVARHEHGYYVERIT